MCTFQMTTVRCACTRLRRAARTVSAVYDEALEPAGLTVVQFALLRALERVGPCSLTGLSAETGHDRTTLNRTLKPLLAAGWISGGEEGRRSRSLALTDAGRAAIARAVPYWEATQARIDAALDGQRQQLFALLDRIEDLRS